MILSPALHASWPAGLAALAYLFAALWPVRSARPAPREDRGVWVALTLGWLAQGAALALDVFPANPGDSSRFGFAPALSMSLWMVVAVYGLESRQLGWPSVRRGLAALSLLVVALAWVFPGQAQTDAVSVWAPLHWLTGLAAYGLIGAALLHAVFLRRAERQMRQRHLQPEAAPAAGLPAAPSALGMPLLQLESLTMKFVVAGFLMLTLTLVLGAAFAQPWRWDHKTVFSVLSWLVFAVFLVGRVRFGWRGRLATRWLMAGSGLLLLAYVGSRFVLEVLLNRANGG
jgi:ABC-type uncharacterized transport system permease subunit